MKTTRLSNVKCLFIFPLFPVFAQDCTLHLDDAAVTGALIKTSEVEMGICHQEWGFRSYGVKPSGPAGLQSRLRSSGLRVLNFSERNEQACTQSVFNSPFYPVFPFSATHGHSAHIPAHVGILTPTHKTYTMHGYGDKYTYVNHFATRFYAQTNTMVSDSVSCSWSFDRCSWRLRWSCQMTEFLFRSFSSLECFASIWARFDCHVLTRLKHRHRTIRAQERVGMGWDLLSPAMFLSK